jgi:hypothetical protein
MGYIDSGVDEKSWNGCLPNETIVMAHWRSNVWSQRVRKANGLG